MYKVICILFLCRAAFAQITITHETVAQSGVTFVLYHAPHDADVDNGDGGANQTWTFPDYEWVGEEVLEVIEPSGSEFHDDFPTATRVIFYPAAHRHEEGSYYYEHVTENGLFSLGFGNITDSDTTAYPYVGTSLQCPLPLSYPSAEWTTVRRWRFEFTGDDSVEVVDSIRSVVDGSGTAVTPFGTYQVIRVFHHDWFATYLPDLPPVTVEYVGYRWIDEACIARIDVVSEDGVLDPDFSEGHLHYTADALDVHPPRGPVATAFSIDQNYPNPFNPTTHLPIHVAQAGNVSLRIYNAAGQLVSEENYSFGPGDYNVPIDGSKWSSGNYFANVSVNDVHQTMKMQLVR